MFFRNQFYSNHLMGTTLLEEEHEGDVGYVEEIIDENDEHMVEDL